MTCTIYEAMLSLRHHLQLLQLKQMRQKSARSVTMVQRIRKNGYENTWKKSVSAKAASELVAADSKSIYSKDLRPNVSMLLYSDGWWKSILRLMVAVASAHPSTLSLLTHYLEMKVKLITEYREFSSKSPQYTGLIATIVSSAELQAMGNSLMRTPLQLIASPATSVTNTTKILLLEILSRLTRKLEPGLRNKLFPIYYGVADAPRIGDAKNGELNFSISPLLAFAYSLRNVQLQHAFSMPLDF
jgi:hypothetical protein